MSTQDKTYVLTIKCPDGVGIVAAVSSFIAEHSGWIVEAKHHSDAHSGMFFMRQEILAKSLPFGLDEFRSRFAAIADRFTMEWAIVDTSKPKRVVLMVSRADHCLSDILHRWRNREYNIEIPCVIGNHETLRDIVEWHNVPFHHVPFPKENKAAAFQQVVELLEANSPELIVLARFMQIVPPEVCERYAGQIINIHHSFLPSFVGAKPYHQAFERGVKLIGASCHYVTSELDAGPIIEQDVVRVNHESSAKDMVRLGKDVEKMVLSRGLRYHLQSRVLVHKNKTVVFH